MQHLKGALPHDEYPDLCFHSQPFTCTSEGARLILLPLIFSRTVLAGKGQSVGKVRAARRISARLSYSGTSVRRVLRTKQQQRCKRNSQLNAERASESETSGWSPVPRDDLVYSPLLKSRAPSQRPRRGHSDSSENGSGLSRARRLDLTNMRVVEEARALGDARGSAWQVRSLPPSWATGLDTRR